MQGPNHRNQHYKVLQEKLTPTTTPPFRHLHDLLSILRGSFIGKGPPVCFGGGAELLLHEVADSCILREGCEGGCAGLLAGSAEDGTVTRDRRRDREELDEEEDIQGQSCDVGEGRKPFRASMTEHHAGGRGCGIGEKADVKGDRYLYHQQELQTVWRLYRLIDLAIGLHSPFTLGDRSVRRLDISDKVTDWRRSRLSS